MKRRWTPMAGLVLVLVGTTLVLGGCGEEDSTENEQAAVRNALAADTTNTQDRPGTPTDTTGGDRTGTQESSAPPVTAESESSPGVEEVVVPAARVALAFTTTRVEAAPGRIELTMANPSDTPHNIAVDKPEKTVGDVVGKGEKSTITVDFPPGRYEYYCSVPGYREAGMEGVLVVR